MKNYQLQICAGLILVSSLCAFNTHAATIDRKVAANRATIIYRFFQFNERTCSAMAVPKYKVISVEHGKITGRKGKFTSDKGPCKGRSFKGIELIYKPNGRYRGVDNARVQLSMPMYDDDTGHTTENVNFRIHVGTK